MTDGGAMKYIERLYLNIISVYDVQSFALQRMVPVSV